MVADRMQPAGGAQRAGDASPAAVRILAVTGGAGSIAAAYEDLTACARLLTDVGRDIAALLASTHPVLADGDLVASSALAPASAARASAAVVEALDGPTGLLACSGRLGALGLTLDAAVLRYQAADRLGDEALTVRRNLAGAAVVLLSPAVVGVGLQTGSLWFLAGRVGGAAAGEGPREGIEELLLARPGIVDEVVGSAPGAVSTATALLLGPATAPVDVVITSATGHTVFPWDVGEGAGLLSLLYAPERAAVTRVGPAAGVVEPPARGVHDLLRGLEQRARLARGRRQGEIGVRRVVTRSADGDRRTAWVVDIPGTRDWQADPRGDRPHLNDLTTSLGAMAGDDTARVEGVAQALAAAGARPEDPVMLVGHSQGGLVAARAAAQWRAGGRYRVTHVVAAGAPLALVDVPREVQVLAIEDRADLVAHLDARDNPDRAHWVTVTTDSASGSERSLGERHSLAATYLPAAALLDAAAADVPALREFVTGAEAFLAAAGEEVEVRTSTYDIRNAA